MPGSPKSFPVRSWVLKSPGWERFRTYGVGGSAHWDYWPCWGSEYIGQNSGVLAAVPQLLMRLQLRGSDGQWRVS